MAIDTHLNYMRQALDLAKKSPPRPTNYRVGAVLVDGKANAVLATGYTLECEGNTHAEQSCFIKLAEEYKIPQDRLGDYLPEVILYTTVEPCSERLSGNLPCVQRILQLKAIKTVYVGVCEPEKFVGENTGRKQLEDAGIKVVLIDGLQEEILQVATAGHT